MPEQSTNKKLVIDMDTFVFVTLSKAYNLLEIHFNFRVAYDTIIAKIAAYQHPKLFCCGLDIYKLNKNMCMHIK